MLKIRLFYMPEDGYFKGVFHKKGYIFNNGWVEEGHPLPNGYESLPHIYVDSLPEVEYPSQMYIENDELLVDLERATEDELKSKSLINLLKKDVSALSDLERTNHLIKCQELKREIESFNEEYSKSRKEWIDSNKLNPVYFRASEPGSKNEKS